MNISKIIYITNLISRSAIIYDVKLPIEYSYFARYTRGFTYNKFKFEFHYPSRLGLIHSTLESDVEKDKFKKAKLKEYSDIFISPEVGEEVVTGSTRMKAGTAQKMVLNMHYFQLQLVMIKPMPPFQ